MNSLSGTFRMNNGYKIPSVGLGTYKMSDSETAVRAIGEAVRAGYRHIDTASFYKNEIEIGEGIRKSGINREDIFLTSKLWVTEQGYDKALEAFEKSLSNLGMEYLDLYLIHWPASEVKYKDWDQINLDTWKALTELYKAGRVKAIGVSNFLPRHLDSLVKTEVPPMVNQIEYHIGHMQEETVAYCKSHDIIVEAWSPLGRGSALNNGTLKSIAEKYGKSVAQICIRWCLQNGIVPLPKSSSPLRIAENIDVFDFNISKEDMEAINAVPKSGSISGHPEETNL